MLPLLSFLTVALVPLVSASPAPVQPGAAVVVPEQALITPSPAVESSPTKTWKQRRDILSDLEGDVNSVLSALGSNIPSYVASGVPNFFQDFPGGADVKKSLGLDDSAVAALPTQVLNIPYVQRLRWLWSIDTDDTTTGRMVTTPTKDGRSVSVPMYIKYPISPKAKSMTWQMIF